MCCKAWHLPPHVRHIGARALRSHCHVNADIYVCKASAFVTCHLGATTADSESEGSNKCGHRRTRAGRQAEQAAGATEAQNSF